MPTKKKGIHDSHPPRKPPTQEPDFRTIKTCAGIGDSIWLFMKLINAGEKFHWQLPDGQPQRGKQIFDLMPQLTASCEYVEGLGYTVIKAMNAGTAGWESIFERGFYLEANSHLEAGKRIEDFLPDLPTSYKLDCVTSEEDKKAAQSHMSSQIMQHIGIYCSAYSNARHWGQWREGEWSEFIHMLHRDRPLTKFILFGADYDMDLTSKIQARMRGIPHITLISRPLGEVVETMKLLDYFIGFPSGLSILNETLHKRGIMFYPQHLVPLMNTWAHPDRIASGEYKAVQTCAPKKLFDWIKENKML